MLVLPKVLESEQEPLFGSLVPPAIETERNLVPALFPLNPRSSVASGMKNNLTLIMMDYSKSYLLRVQDNVFISRLDS